MIILSSQIQLQVSPPRILPVVLNGNFANTSVWVLGGAGGTSTIAIAGGSLNIVGGTSANIKTATQTLSGLTSGATYIVNIDATLVNGPAFAITLGGGTEVQNLITSGAGQTISVVAGSANKDLVIRCQSAASAIRTLVFDNVSLS